MERVTQKDFCEIFEGQFATTEVDRSGEQFTREALQSIEEQVKSNPEKRKVVVNHNSSETIGEILDIYVEDQEKCSVLKGEFGIFEENKEMIDKIKSGELSGLSVSVEQFENTEPGEWETEKPNLTITADPQYRGAINELLKNRDISYRSVIQKSAEAAAIFEIVTKNADTLVAAAIAIHQWYQNNADSDSDGISIEISGDDNTIELSNITEDELVEKLDDDIDE